MTVCSSVSGSDFYVHILIDAPLFQITMKLLILNPSLVVMMTRVSYKSAFSSFLLYVSFYI